MANKKTLWENQGGMVTCLEHGGMYLMTHVKERPNQLDGIVTPLDVWFLVNDDSLECETCANGHW